MAANTLARSNSGLGAFLCHPRPLQLPHTSWPGSFTRCSGLGDTTWTPALSTTKQYQRRALRAAKRRAPNELIPISDDRPQADGRAMAQLPPELARITYAMLRAGRHYVEPALSTNPISASAHCAPPNGVPQLCYELSPTDANPRLTAGYWRSAYAAVEARSVTWLRTGRMPRAYRCFFTTVGVLTPIHRKDEGVGVLTG